MTGCQSLESKGLIRRNRSAQDRRLMIWS